DLPRRGNRLQHQLDAPTAARAVRETPASDPQEDEDGSLDRLRGPGAARRDGTRGAPVADRVPRAVEAQVHLCGRAAGIHPPPDRTRSEEHTSELQSRFDLVCRLLLEK